jgi:hypothetical protein
MTAATKAIHASFINGCHLEYTASPLRAILCKFWYGRDAGRPKCFPSPMRIWVFWGRFDKGRAHGCGILLST